MRGGASSSSSSSVVVAGATAKMFSSIEIPRDHAKNLRTHAWHTRVSSGHDTRGGDAGRRRTLGIGVEEGGPQLELLALRVEGE